MPLAGLDALCAEPRSSSILARVGMDGHVKPGFDEIRGHRAA
jgi:hypothetical protein